MGSKHAIAESTPAKEAQERIWDAFRRWGYLQANLDPLGDLEPVAMPELEVQGAEAEAARRFYCGTLGAEFMHIPDRERRLWVQERMEARNRDGTGPCAHPRSADPGGNFRAGSSNPLSWHETIFSRG